MKLAEGMLPPGDLEGEREHGVTAARVRVIAEASGAAARVALGQQPRQSARIIYPHLTQTFKINYAYP